MNVVDTEIPWYANKMHNNFQTCLHVSICNRLYGIYIFFFFFEGGIYISFTLPFYRVYSNVYFIKKKSKLTINYRYFKVTMIK